MFKGKKVGSYSIQLSSPLLGAWEFTLLLMNYNLPGSLGLLRGERANLQGPVPPGPGLECPR